MGRSCATCRYREVKFECEPCCDCRLKGIDHPNWEPICPEFIYKPLSKKTLNYLYGTKNMDVASMYPKHDLPINNEILEYFKNDVEETMSIGELYRLERDAKKIGCRVVAESWFRSVNMPGIEKVIFNDPATIVIWDDGTKTIVKTQGDDIFDPEKGLAMAVSKKALGNKGNYFEEFKKWLPEETAPKTKPCKDFECFMILSEAARNAQMVVEKEVMDEIWQDMLAK